MALKAILLLAIVATSFTGAFAQARCDPQTADFNSVLETHTAALLPAVALVGGTDTITGVGIFSTEAGHGYLSVGFTGRAVTFTPTEFFKDYLDLGRQPELLTGEYYVNCTPPAGAGNPYTEFGSFRIQINDTNNRPPVFDIKNDYLQLNRDTWISNDPINYFEGPLTVYDMDFRQEYASVEITSNKDIVLIQHIRTADEGKTWNTTFNLFLKPDTDYGNYTIELTATDGANTASKNITLYVGAGAQFQATAALTALLVSVATWFNMK